MAFTRAVLKEFFFVKIRSSSLQVLYEMKYKMSPVSSKPITVVGYHRRAAAIDLKKKKKSLESNEAMMVTNYLVDLQS